MLIYNNNNIILVITLLRTYCGNLNDDGHERDDVINRDDVEQDDRGGDSYV